MSLTSLPGFDKLGREEMASSCSNLIRNCMDTPAI